MWGRGNMRDAAAEGLVAQSGAFAGWSIRIGGLMRRPFLSTLPGGAFERRLAVWLLIVSALAFLAAAPFAKLPLAQVTAFLPAYQSALVVNDLITAILFYGQFGILRSRALLILASAYFFSALMAIAHALSFPGLFA